MENTHSLISVAVSDIIFLHKFCRIFPVILVFPDIRRDQKYGIITILLINIPQFLIQLCLLCLIQESIIVKYPGDLFRACRIVLRGCRHRKWHQKSQSKTQHRSF